MDVLSNPVSIRCFTLNFTDGDWIEVVGMSRPRGYFALALIHQPNPVVLAAGGLTGIAGDDDEITTIVEVYSPSDDLYDQSQKYLEVILTAASHFLGG